MSAPTEKLANDSLLKRFLGYRQPPPLCLSATLVIKAKRVRILVIGDQAHPLTPKQEQREKGTKEKIISNYAFFLMTTTHLTRWAREGTWYLAVVEAMMYLPTRAPLSDLILTIVRSFAGSIPCTSMVSTVPTLRRRRLSRRGRTDAQDTLKHTSARFAFG